MIRNAISVGPGASDGIARDGDALRLLTAPGRDQPTGVYRAQDDVLSLYFPGRGGTYDFTRVPEHGVTDFYARGRPNQKYLYALPLATHDGWPVRRVPHRWACRKPRSKPSSRALSNAPVDSVHAPQIHAILLARHGVCIGRVFSRRKSRSAARPTLGLEEHDVDALRRGHPSGTSGFDVHARL